MDGPAWFDGLLKPSRGYGEIVHICYNLSIFNLFSTEIDGMKKTRISSFDTLRQIEEGTRCQVSSIDSHPLKIAPPIELPSTISGLTVNSIDQRSRKSLLSGNIITNQRQMTSAGQITGGNEITTNREREERTNGR